MSLIPGKKADVVAKNVAGEMVLLIPSSGKYFGLNGVGTFFWEKMDGQSTIDEIAELIAGQYSIDISMAKADLLELANDLAANHLINLK